MIHEQDIKIITVGIHSGAAVAVGNLGKESKVLIVGGFATSKRLTGEAGLQSSLFNDVRREENLREAVRQLEVRLGRRPPIYQVREVEPWSRIPERRQALVQYVP